ncbi:MAG: SGNH/GDSL hydrolase family protein [Candidatus Marinimicrobia bacterium]|nr:SGNH/GDSL hydrolase family protein [Candidatus Neomarinimicrobiota bacterium]
MKIRVFTILILMIVSGLAEDKLRYTNATELRIQGTAFSVAEKENPFHRLPRYAQELVRREVWDLSTNSAGIFIDFYTNSSFLKLKWEVTKNFTMEHMAGTGIRGLDLYCKNKGKWQYVATAKSAGKVSEKVIIENMSGTMKEFRLYLPLYDGIESLEIGIHADAQIEKGQAYSEKPLVFYGTSITQGGCASRPGMAYPNIISRKLDKNCINLGFSGNGWLQEPMARILAGIEADMIVLDCLPNMTIKMVHENIPKAIDIIRQKQPQVPIVLVENINYETNYFNFLQYQDIYDKNGALRYEFNQLMENNYRNIYLLSAKGLIGLDHEGTVDGVHLTDLGFLRFAENFIARLKKQGLIK